MLLHVASQVLPHDISTVAHMCLSAACISIQPYVRRNMQGTAFSMSERERLELRGLLPRRMLSMETQVSFKQCCITPLDCAMS